MVKVRMSETYDLSTQVDKMGVIGVHTPSTMQINRIWGNVLKSHKFMRIDSCDITIACASMLPADPLQIGTEAGDIAPQDMFNPILYRAVSNDSFNTLTNRIYGGTPVHAQTGLDVGVLDRNDVDSNAFNTYYALLADPDGWRKAMPQAGLEMHGLYPLVYQLVNTYGNQVSSRHVTVTDSTPVFENNLTDLEDVTYALGTDQSNEPAVSLIKKAVTFRGPSMRMPAIPTKLVQNTTVDDVTQTVLAVSEIPQTYVACIITPPAKLNRLYYRMKVTWTIEFTGLISDLEMARMSDLNTVGQLSYASDYVIQSKSMDNTTSSVDVKDASIDLVMTSAS